MTKLEKFALTTGIIGLMVDLIGLTTFLAGLWGHSPQDSTPGELPRLFQLIFGFTILYGWLSISWVLVRRAFLSRKYKRQNVLHATLKTVFGVGILVTPLICGWGVAVSRSETVSAEAEYYRDEATLAAQMAAFTPTPITTRGPYKPTLADRRSSASFNVYFCLVPSIPLLGIGVFLILSLLMPTVYPDMPEVKFGDIVKLLPVIEDDSVKDKELEDLVTTFKKLPWDKRREVLNVALSHLEKKD